MRNYRNKNWLENKYTTEKHSIREISKLCNCNEGTIRRWLHKFNLRVRHGLEARISNRKKYTDRDWLTEQYVDKMNTQMQIAEECNCSDGTIRRWMKYFNISVRSESEARSLRHSAIEAKYKNPEFLRNEYINKKKSSVKIAEELGCTRPTILEWLRHFDIPVRNISDGTSAGMGSYDRKFADKEWLLDKYMNSWASVEEIANKCNTDTDTIYRWLKKFNIPITHRGALNISLPEDFRYCSLCNTIKHESKFIPSCTCWCKECRNMKEHERRRNLDSIPLNDNYDGSEAHHITDDYILYIPKEIHRQCNGHSREVHRTLVFNKLIEEGMETEVDLILSHFNEDWQNINVS